MNRAHSRGRGLDLSTRQTTSFSVRLTSTSFIRHMLGLHLALAAAGGPTNWLYAKNRLNIKV